MIKDRLAKLRTELVKKEVDWILISQPKNMCYLSGFNSADGYLLITAKDTIIATDFRYVEQVKSSAPIISYSRLLGKCRTGFRN